jgi:hypothetical protein
VPDRKLTSPAEDSDLVGAIAFFGAIATMLGILVIAFWSLFVDAPDEVQADTGWRPICTATADVETTQMIPFGGELGLIMGGSPAGPTSRTVTTTICRRTVWRCAPGRQCDPTQRPGTPEDQTDAR